MPGVGLNQKCVSLTDDPNKNSEEGGGHEVSLNLKGPSRLFILTVSAQ